jgi:predicted CXXCH cytochrome family protein
MRTIRKLIVPAMLMVAFGGQADVRDTKHNLARGPTGQPTTEAREVCVFCHTPVVGVQGVLGGNTGPQWQPSVPGSYAFTLYDDTGRNGVDGSTVIGSQSMVCLSCHDATQAMTVTTFGTDHPFGVPFRGGPTDKAAREAALRAARESGNPMIAGRFVQEDSGFNPAQVMWMDGREIWWIPATRGAVTRSKSDLPLYPRADGSGVAVPFIECTSCHDPHSSNDLFLRVSNQESRLCLTCHSK